MPARRSAGQAQCRPGAVPARRSAGQAQCRPGAVPARRSVVQAQCRPGAVLARHSNRHLRPCERSACRYQPIPVSEIAGISYRQRDNTYLSPLTSATSHYTQLPTPETLYHRDDALLYIAYVMFIWAAPIPADRWHCSLWP